MCQAISAAAACSQCDDDDAGMTGIIAWASELHCHPCPDESMAHK